VGKCPTDPSARVIRTVWCLQDGDRLPDRQGPSHRECNLRVASPAPAPVASDADDTSRAAGEPGALMMMRFDSSDGFVVTASAVTPSRRHQPPPRQRCHRRLRDSRSQARQMKQPENSTKRGLLAGFAGRKQPAATGSDPRTNENSTSTNSRARRAARTDVSPIEVRAFVAVHSTDYFLVGSGWARLRSQPAKLALLTSTPMPWWRKR
jgi:hypothetical protein